MSEKLKSRNSLTLNVLLQLTKETQELEAKYKTLSEAQGEVISKEEREKIRSDREKALKHWRKRKRICMDMVNAVLDNSEMKKAQLLEEMGIETDEDYGIKMPEQ